MTIKIERSYSTCDGCHVRQGRYKIRNPSYEKVFNLCLSCLSKIKEKTK